MSTTTGDSKVPNVSKQLTKSATVFTKLEWRIEDFEKLTRLYDLEQSFSSKTFITPHLQAVWQLDVYPRGKNGYSRSYFYLRLTGFQAPDGSLSANNGQVITADYKIYLLSSTNEKGEVAESATKFKVGTTSGPWRGEYEAIAGKFIHPDGSLLVICEVNCLAPEETFSMESPPNLQLTNNFKELWKSQLFSDCTLEVGSKSFPAHKCILGQWSQVFRNMFSLPMEESESGVVEITDFGPDEISAMLEYMYTGVVKNEVMCKLAPELLALSDKYAVIPLKDLCEAFLASKLTMTNFLQIVILADRYSAAKLKKACINRLAIDGRAVLQSQEWEDLKSKDKDLANELLELMIKFC